MKRFLLIDPNAYIHGIIAAYFDSRGETLLVKADLTEAVEFIQNSMDAPFDGIILSPGKDRSLGVAAIKTLRMSFPDMPIIIFTGAGDIPDLKQAYLAAGADRYVSKSGSPHVLLIACWDAIESRPSSPAGK